MSKLTDKLIVFIICIAMLSQHQADVYIVVPVICAIGASALLSYCESLACAGVLIIWCAVCMLVPAFIFFLPLICYDLFISRWRWALAAALFPLAAAFSELPLDTFIFIALFIALAYLLKRRSADLERTQAEYLALRDATKEFSMHLENKNKELLEKQDYEIHLATLGERNRIARDIHDNIGHLLSNSILQTGAMLATCRDDALRERLQTLKDTLADGMNSIRDSIHDLHDESVELHAEVNSLVSGFVFCEVSLDYDVDSSPPKTVKYALLAVVKEALSNIARHSNATRASVTIREHPAFYQLIVRDDGTKKTTSVDGIGLKNIAQRVQSLHGHVNFNGDNGFTVFVSIPKESSL